MKIIFRKIGIMTSQRGSMFQNSEIVRSEKLFWLNQSYYMSWFWHFYRQLYMTYKLSLFDLILRWWRHNMGLEFHDFEKKVSLTNASPKSSFYFRFSSFYHHWYMRQEFGYFLTNFGLMMSPMESKLQYFEEVISQTNSLLQSSMKYWFWSFYHSQYLIYNFEPVLPNFEIMTSQKSKCSRILKT